ncbi:hypothetical protein CKY39_08050 [Variovorax boronicumulans]|uniref:Uncharacterized protein n=1 Tax=Variovorax boronicumulans TaxID=436515 RepID=A0A250DFM3_9BURK|nr:hypothetical protein CKY39_08050 [Variovorax boronicumulans]
MCLEVVQRIFATDEDVLSCTGFGDVVLVERCDFAGRDFLLKLEKMFFLNLENLEAIGGDFFFGHEHRAPGETIGMPQIGIHEYFAIVLGHACVRGKFGQQAK